MSVHKMQAIAPNGQTISEWFNFILRLAITSY